MSDLDTGNCRGVAGEGGAAPLFSFPPLPPSVSPLPLLIPGTCVERILRAARWAGLWGPWRGSVLASVRLAALLGSRQTPTGWDAAAGGHPCEGQCEPCRHESPQESKRDLPQPAVTYGLIGVVGEICNNNKTHSTCHTDFGQICHLSSILMYDGSHDLDEKRRDQTV